MKPKIKPEFTLVVDCFRPKDDQEVIHLSIPKGKPSFLESIGALRIAELDLIDSEFKLVFSGGHTSQEAFIISKLK